MDMISHRGNVNGKNIEKENSLEYLLEALDEGFDIEFDVWFVDNNFYIGSNQPKQLIDYSFLQGKRKWINCKNPEAFFMLYDDPSVHCFYLDDNKYTLTNCKYIITTGKICKDAICLLPECSEKKYTSEELESCAGICSDYIVKYKIAHEVRQNIKKRHK